MHKRLRGLSAALLAILLCPSIVCAYEVQTEPKFLFNTLGPGYVPTSPFFDSPEQSFAWMQTAAMAASPRYMLSNQRPMPSYGGVYATTYNGTHLYYLWDEVACGYGPCTGPSSVQGKTQLSARCPAGFILKPINSDPVNRQVVCSATFPDAEEPPDCNSCIGNPIFVGTGLKLQVEQDYSGPSGLVFTRSYRSSLGFFASDTTQAFIDSSAPALTTSTSCFPASYLDPTTQAQKSHCFRYVSSGQQSYRLFTSTGRYVRFSGPLGAVVASADINDKVFSLSAASGGGWRVRREDNSFETYSPTGVLVSRVTHDGRSFSYQYSDPTTSPSIAPRPGLLVSKADSFGHFLAWQYDGNGRVTTMTDPAGGVYSYVHDTVGRLTGITYPDGTGKTYHYNEAAYTSGTDLPKALTGITDENQSRFSIYKYSAQGLARGTEHAGGAERFIVNGGTVTDPLNTNRFYSFRTILSYVRDAAVNQPGTSGGTVSRTQVQDVNGNTTQLVDFKGNRACYTFDLTRNLELAKLEGLSSSSSCPANIGNYAIPANTRQRKISTQWHPHWRLPIRRASPRLVTTHVYNGQPDPSNGNAIENCAPLSATLPDGSPIAVLCKRIEEETTDTAGSAGFSATLTGVNRTWSHTYNSFGQVLTTDGPRTDVTDLTTYTYYSCTTGYQCGQVETITNALGHITTYNTYNAHGQPLTITDPNGVVTTLTYDLRQRLTSRTVGSEQTTFEYWPTGLLKKATLPDGSFLEYAYDAAHRLTQIRDSEGHHIVYTLDAMGNRTAEQIYDPSSSLTQTRTRVFNTLNQLWKEIGAAGTANVTTAFSYDNNGNQTGITAPLGRNTIQAYDELNRLQQVTDPLSGITQYGYNALDQLISVTDPRSKVTSYSYNALGDLTQQVSPDTGTTANTYDSGGNLKTSTDARAKTATYGYDALNRVTSLSYPDQTIGYSYDAGTNQKGRLTQLSDASGSTSWSYDAQGRVLTRQQSMGIAKTLGYAYDTAGRLQTLTLPSGTTVSYGYTNGKVTSLTLNGSTTILSNVLYQPFGPTRGWTWGNSSLAVREYDSDGKVTDIDSAGLKTYSYDDAFRLTGITDAANSSLSQSYGYDLLDRLTSATGTSLNQGWSYDANGNRLTQTGTQASTYTIASTNNRISSISGALSRTYGYDNSGNTTSDGATTFTYNDAGRMTSATKAGITTTYALNALGQRVKKTTSGASTYFAYDDAGHLVGEYDNSGNLIQETVWFGDTPVATLKPNGGGGVNLFYIHTDHLNTPRRISRPSDNAIVWRWDSDPFGTSAVNQDPDGDSSQFVYNLRFPGQYLDQETGLHYNYFRDYEPATGRYPQSDPIGLQGGLNTYAYANLNPVSYADPSGLVPGPYTGFDKIPSSAVPSTGAVGVSVRCGLLPAVMGGSSGGVHCEVVATCKKTGETVAFGIGGGGNGIWERLFGGKTPPKYQNPAPALPPSEIAQYTASCGDGEDCGCKALECFKQMQAGNTPPPYYALRRNSNSYAHFLLNQCGCSLNGDPSGAVAW